MTKSTPSGNVPVGVRIGFVLLSRSDAPIPSTRVSVLNMWPFLREAGFVPGIAFEPEDAIATPDLSCVSADHLAQEFDIVFFQKVHGPTVAKLASELTARGVKTIYGVCDWFDRPMCEAVDAVVVVTDFLKSLHPEYLHHKIHVVHDGIEHPEVCKSDWGTHHGSPRQPLHAVLVTSHPLEHLPVLGVPPPWLDVTIVGHYPGRASVTGKARDTLRQLAAKDTLRAHMDYLRFASHPRIHLKPWHARGVYDELVKADIGILPIDTNTRNAYGLSVADALVKSENRLTLKMAAGLPVVATPIPAYEALVRQGVNAFLADSRENWLKDLDSLRDPAKRQHMGHQARASVLPRFSVEEQARRLVAVLKGLFQTGTIKD